MEDITNTNQQEIYLSDRDIFINIWTSPRQILKYINDNSYDKFVYFLLVIAGISNSLSNAASSNIGNKTSVWAIIGMCIVVGGLFGWLPYRIYAALISWTGNWLKAQGDTHSILRMLAYAILPSIISLAFFIPQIAIYGKEFFKSDGDITSAGSVSDIFVYISIFLKFALGIWTIVFMVIGISEVQKLSIGKSILNLLLPLVVILVPLMIIALIFKALIN